MKSNTQTVIEKPDTPPPQHIEGCENINRYWDRTRSIYVAKILPGEFYLTTYNEAIATILGSCVAACVYDRAAKIGGMNHFLLPTKGCTRSTSDNNKFNNTTRFGNWAMEVLINAILKHGGKRRNLEIKVFGGAQMSESMVGVGKSNIEFIQEYVHEENIRLVAEDLGGKHARKVLFFPETGAVKIKKINHVKNNTIFDREKNYLEHVTEEVIDSSIELFD